MKSEPRPIGLDLDELGIAAPVDDTLFAVPPPLDAQPAVPPASASNAQPAPVPILGVLWRAVRRRRS